MNTTDYIKSLPKDEQEDIREETETLLRECEAIDFLRFVKPSQPKKEKVNKAVAWGVR